MTIRIAPESGYDFPSKRAYRRNIWATFKRQFGGQVAGRQMALMPSIEGDEIEVALSKGFREENLHVIDFNPAIVASLKRRYPRLHTYGVPVRRAIIRMAEAGTRLDGFNLDLCSNLSREVRATLFVLSFSRIMTNESVVAVSLLRGRELGVTGVMLDELAEASNNTPWRHELEQRYGASLIPSDMGRISLTVESLTGNMPRRPDMPPVLRPYLLRIGKYKSTAGRQTMLWQMFNLHYTDCHCGHCAEFGSEYDKQMRETIASWWEEDDEITTVD